MKVLEAIKTGKVTIEEIIDFVEGNLSNYEQIGEILNEISGFKSTKIDTDDNWDSDSILECELIEVDII